jgi:3-methyladenine DNA glycosylase Mpg
MISSITPPCQSSTLFKKEKYLFTDFESIAYEILNSMILTVNKVAQFRICEIEMYFKDRKSHVDPYVHGSPDQLTCGNYYFHKFSNGTYKAGTFKGMDITFGNENCHFGVLIRSIENIETHQFIEGPCNVVNTFLSYFKVNNVRELMNLDEFSNLPIVACSHELLCLSSMPSSTDTALTVIKDLEDPQRISLFSVEKVYCGPRIGLSEKNKTEQHAVYRKRHYRFVIKRDKIKKQKKTLIEC